ncbi:MAG: hypothetical protein AAFO99_00405 [Bacteroidota bacterium]
MKTHHFVLFAPLFLTLTSFDSELDAACKYAGSNIDYVKSQTQRAIDADNLNSSRFFAYKALNAIEKSKKQFEACGCDYALKNIYEGLDNLKRATRTTSLDGAKILLKRALENELGSLEAIEKHHLHNSRYSSDVLTMNTKSSEAERKAMKQPKGRLLHERIDKTLINFENSLEEVVQSVACEEALSFSQKIYDHCEQELLKPNLTEAKKYYNLRTKEIVAEALLKLEECN